MKKDRPKLHRIVFEYRPADAALIAAFKSSVHERGYTMAGLLRIWIRDFIAKKAVDKPAEV